MLLIGIEPKAPGLHIFSQSKMPRLGLPQLLTMAKQMGHQCRIYCEDLAPINWSDVRQADMVLISSLTSTAPRAYAMIRKIKAEIKPGVPILIGGPHTTFLPEEALSRGADYVFRHEADESFPAFLRWYEAGRNLQELMAIDGLSFRAGDQFHHTPDPRRVDLDLLPTPDLDLIVGFRNPMAIPMITSRGCPENCEFCSEIYMFGHAYRFRSEELCIQDIKYYHRRYGKVSIFFADDNLGANTSRLGRFCASIAANHLERSYSGQIRLDLAKYPELLERLRRIGFERAYIGYESTNDQALEAVGKRIRANEMEEYTKIIHHHGIEIHAMWVIGFDADSIETVKDNVRAAIKWRIETNQFLILVPIPGSDLYPRLVREKRIFNPNWEKFDGHHVVFYPAGMSPRQLQVAVMLEAMPKLYNLWQTFKIFTTNGFKIALDAWTAMRQHRRWHPLHDAKRNFMTMLLRLAGKITVYRKKKSAKQYARQLPS
jgi:radical SAM superfamily enzyme YgiQ (UPF0313 family)